MEPPIAETPGGAIGTWLQLAWWDVQAFFGNDDAKSHAEAYRQVQSRATPEDIWIYETVESEQIEHGGFFGQLEKTVKTFWANTRKVIELFPLIGIIVGALIVFFIVYYYLPKRRKA